VKVFSVVGGCAGKTGGPDRRRLRPRWTPILKAKSIL
jgi:hypothetical protein